MFTLGVRDTSASSVQHPIFQLCVCFEIVPDKPFGVVILFYPLSSVKLPIFICLTSLLHTTFVRSLPFCFRKFLTIFSIFGADENRWHQPRNFRRLCVIFADALCSSVSWTGPFLCLIAQVVQFLFVIHLSIMEI